MKCLLCCALSHRKCPPDAAVLTEHSSPAVFITEKGGKSDNIADLKMLDKVDKTDLKS